MAAGTTGLPMSTMVQLTPFVLLGVGADDMIIITESFDTCRHIANIGDRLSKSLKIAGVSITLTSLCTVAGFGVGSIIDMPGVRAFCVYAAFSFFGNYILQFLIYAPLLVFDARRQKRKQNFCCCCCKNYRLFHFNFFKD